MLPGTGREGGAAHGSRAPPAQQRATSVSEAACQAPKIHKYLPYVCITCMYGIISSGAAARISMYFDAHVTPGRGGWRVLLAILRTCMYIPRHRRGLLPCSVLAVRLSASVVCVCVPCGCGAGLVRGWVELSSGRGETRLGTYPDHPGQSKAAEAEYCHVKDNSWRPHRPARPRPRTPDTPDIDTP